jgi:hypothetical protein
MSRKDPYCDIWGAVSEYGVRDLKASDQWSDFIDSEGQLTPKLANSDRRNIRAFVAYHTFALHYQFKDTDKDAGFEALNHDGWGKVSMPGWPLFLRCPRGSLFHCCSEVDWPGALSP